MSKPLYLCVEQEFVGEQRLIAETLKGLADLLEREIVAKPKAERVETATVDASAYLQMLSDQNRRLAEAFALAGPSFSAAVEPTGSPHAYSAAYSALLDALRTTSNAVWAIKAPRALTSTEQAYRGLVRAMLDQLQSWPQQLRDAAGRVTGESFEMRLEINVKIAPFERAMTADTKALGI